MIAGNYYIVTVPSLNAVVSLDISDPAKPREVSRLVLGPEDVPHWIALEPNHQRVVITGYGALWRIASCWRASTPRTGKLALDARFRDAGASQPGVRMEGRKWPHGGSAAGAPHGAVFSKPAPARR